MREWQRKGIVAAAAAAALTIGPARFAAAKQRAGQAAQAVQAPIDEKAVDAVDDMGKYLRGLKTFEVQAEITDEDVLDTGEKLQRASNVTVLADRPGRMRAEVTSDRHQRVYYFDGKTFTLVADRMKYYATTPAPKTIGELIDKLEETYGFSAPLTDLFRWGEKQEKNLIGAIDVGPAVVDGTTCEHYAFRQREIDWQVWIQKGEFPLPRKLVITTKTDPARPQHTAIYTWNLAPSFNAAAFTYEPGPGMRRVELARQAPLAPPAKQKKPVKVGEKGKEGTP